MSDIRVIPNSEKLEAELRAGTITVDEFLDKIIENMIAGGLMERVAENEYTITPKGLQVHNEIKRRALRADIEHIIDSDLDVTVRDGVATANTKTGKW